MNRRRIFWILFYPLVHFIMLYPLIGTGLTSVLPSDAPMRSLPPLLSILLAIGGVLMIPSYLIVWIIFPIIDVFHFDAALNFFLTLFVLAYFSGLFYVGCYFLTRLLWQRYCRQWFRMDASSNALLIFVREYRKRILSFLSYPFLHMLFVVALSTLFNVLTFFLLGIIPTFIVALERPVGWILYFLLYPVNVLLAFFPFLQTPEYRDPSFLLIWGLLSGFIYTVMYRVLWYVFWKRYLRPFFRKDLSTSEIR